MAENETHIRVPRRTRFLQRPDFRPLNPIRSIRVKLGLLVIACVAIASFFTWLMLIYFNIGPTRTFPVVFIITVIITQVLANGMTKPLRDMTRAATRMAGGDYATRVDTASRDEVGELASAFNIMAFDLGMLDEQRREMIANLSHELRTPVAALQAELENLVDGVTKADPETLEVALAQTERLGRLVTYILDLSRIESGSESLDIIDLDLQNFFTEAVEGAELVASSSHRAVTFTIEVTPPGLRLPADPERLHQVLANLLTNAVRHSPSGGVITVRGYERDRWITLDVVDQGPGIPRGDRAKVFSRFERGNSARVTGTTSTGGTGLGLAIAKWAVELHNGTIAVADVSPGCTMRVRLPKDRKEISKGLAIGG